MGVQLKLKNTTTTITFLELGGIAVQLSRVEELLVEEPHGFRHHLLVDQLLDPSIVVEKAVVATTELSTYHIKLNPAQPWAVRTVGIKLTARYGTERVLTVLVEKN